MQPDPDAPVVNAVCMPTISEKERAGATFHARAAKVATGTTVVGQRLYMKNAMQDISTTLCRLVTHQVCAVAMAQARFVGKAAFIGLSVPTNKLLPLVRDSA